MLSTLLARVAALLTGAIRATSGGSFWFPPQASTGAQEVDWLFDFILWISIVFFVLIVVMMTVFVARYRRRPGLQAEKTATHNTPLELAWTIVPTLLVAVIYYFGISGYLEARTPPRYAHEVQVTGQKWQWLFTYKNGVVSDELHVPVDEPTQLIMRSEDVIHSFYVPAFRVKWDVVPGRYGKLWFTPTQTGEYNAFCTEYCGDNHSYMSARVFVHEAGGVEKWLNELEEKNNNKPPAELGADIYNGKGGCKTCHSLDGSRVIGPTFKGAWGRTELLSDGQKVEVDENYIRESIMEPQAKIVAGYPAVMPTFKGKLKDKEITGLIEFIKTVK